MKVFYLILCACFAVFITIESKDTAKEYQERLRTAQNHHNACKNASGITLEFLENFNKTDDEMEPSELEELQTKIGCYLSCILEEKGLMNGTYIDLKQLIDMMTQDANSSEEKDQAVVEMIGGIVEGCGKQVENITNVCSLGWKFFNCMGDIVGL